MYNVAFERNKFYVVTFIPYNYIYDKDLRKVYVRSTKNIQNFKV